ncbi:MAG: dioxygenase [Betaproteobacteria bacterium]|nr:MAG: dioxygenase [Betaproteobacteria bacterium]
MADRLPAYFVSHGAPVLALDTNDPTHRFFRELGPSLGKPQAVLVVSAHWEAEQPRVSGVSQPETIHDFHGFPGDLYRMSYPAPGAPQLAQRVVQLLDEVGIHATVDAQRGIDHGAWIPLALMYPEADVPVIELSVQVGSSNYEHYVIGRALRPLRSRGVLILGSGGLTHNLAEVELGSSSKTLPMWAEEFRTWVVNAIERGRYEDLLEYESLAPHAHRNHPRDEHFLPLLAALGAGDTGRRVHSDVSFRSLAMDAFRFD